MTPPHDIQPPAGCRIAGDGAGRELCMHGRTGPKELQGANCPPCPLRDRSDRPPNHLGCPARSAYAKQSVHAQRFLPGVKGSVNLALAPSTSTTHKPDRAGPGYSPGHLQSCNDQHPRLVMSAFAHDSSPFSVGQVLFLLEEPSLRISISSTLLSSIFLNRASLVHAADLDLDVEWVRMNLSSPSSLLTGAIFSTIFSAPLDLVILA
jgi:hypothetical protein